MATTAERTNSVSVPLAQRILGGVIGGIVGGLVFGAFSRGYVQGAVLGLLYGAIWWVLGPLILMPLLVGMGGPQFGMALSPPMLMSLVGHLVYGLLTGVVYVAYVAYLRSRSTSHAGA